MQKSDISVPILVYLPTTFVFPLPSSHKLLVHVYPLGQAEQGVPVKYGCWPRIFPLKMIKRKDPGAACYSV